MYFYTTTYVLLMLFLKVDTGNMEESGKVFPGGHLSYRRKRNFFSEDDDKKFKRKSATPRMFLANQNNTRQSSTKCYITLRIKSSQVVFFFGLQLLFD